MDTEADNITSLTDKFFQEKNLSNFHAPTFPPETPTLMEKQFVFLKHHTPCLSHPGSQGLAVTYRSIAQNCIKDKLKVIGKVEVADKQTNEQTRKNTLQII